MSRALATAFSKVTSKASLSTSLSVRPATSEVASITGTSVTSAVASAASWGATDTPLRTKVGVCMERRGK